MTELTQEQKATNAETLEHIQNVRNLLNLAIAELLKRGEQHDQSKLGDPELATFVEFTPKLKGSTYGSEEYKGFLREMKPALDNHYRCNRHHPEHFGRSGIGGMNLIDLLEMVLDWKAATMRHADGDLWRSLDINRARFSIGDQLFKILENTVRDLQLVTRDYDRKSPFMHGYDNCTLDALENAPFSGIGGLEARTDPKAPHYIDPENAAEYIRGYTTHAREAYGADWRTCEFGWQAAVKI